MLHGKASGLSEMSAVQTVALGKLEKIDPYNTSIPQVPWARGPLYYNISLPKPSIGRGEVVSKGLRRRSQNKASVGHGPPHTCDQLRARLPSRFSQIESPKMMARGGVPRSEGSQ